MLNAASAEERKEQRRQRMVGRQVWKLCATGKWTTVLEILGMRERDFNSSPKGICFLDTLLPIGTSDSAASSSVSSQTSEKESDSPENKSKEESSDGNSRSNPGIGVFPAGDSIGAVHLAAVAGNVDVLAALCRRGASLSISSSVAGITPLHACLARLQQIAQCHAQGAINVAERAARYRRRAVEDCAKVAQSRGENGGGTGRGGRGGDDGEGQHRGGGTDEERLWLLEVAQWQTRAGLKEAFHMAGLSGEPSERNLADDLRECVRLIVAQDFASYDETGSAVAGRRTEPHGSALAGYSLQGASLLDLCDSKGVSARNVLLQGAVSCFRDGDTTVSCGAAADAFNLRELLEKGVAAVERASMILESVKNGSSGDGSSYDPNDFQTEVDPLLRAAFTKAMSVVSVQNNDDLTLGESLFHCVCCGNLKGAEAILHLVQQGSRGERLGSFESLFSWRHPRARQSPHGNKSSMLHIASDKYWRTPLHAIAVHGSTAMAKLLLARAAPLLEEQPEGPDGSSSRSRTPFRERRFFSSSVLLQLVDGNGLTPLALLCSLPPPPLLSRNQDRGDDKCAGNSEVTAHCDNSLAKALSEAVESQTELEDLATPCCIAEDMIAAGAIVDVPHASDGRTPLMFAYGHGHSNLVQLLLEYGHASVVQPDWRGLSTLDLCLLEQQQQKEEEKKAHSVAGSDDIEALYRQQDERRAKLRNKFNREVSESTQLLGSASEEILSMKVTDGSGSSTSTSTSTDNSTDNSTDHSGSGSEKFVWEWRNDDDVSAKSLWEPYPDSVSARMETTYLLQAASKGPVPEVVYHLDVPEVGNITFHLDVVNLCQTNTSTNFKRRIRRRGGAKGAGNSQKDAVAAAKATGGAGPPSNSALHVVKCIIDHASRLHLSGGSFRYFRIFRPATSNILSSSSSLRPFTSDAQQCENFDAIKKLLAYFVGTTNRIPYLLQRLSAQEEKQVDALVLRNDVEGAITQSRPAGRAPLEDRWSGNLGHLDWRNALRVYVPSSLCWGRDFSAPSREVDGDVNSPPRTIATTVCSCRNLQDFGCICSRGSECSSGALGAFSALQFDVSRRRVQFTTQPRAASHVCPTDGNRSYGDEKAQNDEVERWAMAATSEAFPQPNKASPSGGVDDRSSLERSEKAEGASPSSSGERSRAHHQMYMFECLVSRSNPGRTEAIVGVVDDAAIVVHRDHPPKRPARAPQAPAAEAWRPPSYSLPATAIAFDAGRGTLLIPDRKRSNGEPAASSPHYRRAHSIDVSEQLDGMVPHWRTAPQLVVGVLVNFGEGAPTEANTAAGSAKEKNHNGGEGSNADAAGSAAAGSAAAEVCFFVEGVHLTTIPYSSANDQAQLVLRPMVVLRDILGHTTAGADDEILSASKEGGEARRPLFVQLLSLGSSVDHMVSEACRIRDSPRSPPRDVVIVDSPRSSSTMHDSPLTFSLDKESGAMLVELVHIIKAEDMEALRVFGEFTVADDSVFLSLLSTTMPTGLEDVDRALYKLASFSNGFSILHLAASLGVSEETIRALVSHFTAAQKRIQAAKLEKQTAFRFDMQESLTRRFFLRSFLNQRDMNLGSNPMHWAAYLGNLPALKALLDQDGCDIDAVSRVTRTSLLLWASWVEDLACANAILDAGGASQLLWPNSSGETACSVLLAAAPTKEQRADQPQAAAQEEDEDAKAEVDFANPEGSSALRTLHRAAKDLGIVAQAYFVDVSDQDGKNLGPRWCRFRLPKKALENTSKGAVRYERDGETATFIGNGGDPVFEFGGPKFGYEMMLGGLSQNGMAEDEETTSGKSEGVAILRGVCAASCPSTLLWDKIAVDDTQLKVSGDRTVLTSSSSSSSSSTKGQRVVRASSLPLLVRSRESDDLHSRIGGKAESAYFEVVITVKGTDRGHNQQQQQQKANRAVCVGVSMASAKNISGIKEDGEPGYFLLDLLAKELIIANTQMRTEPLESDSTAVTYDTSQASDDKIEDMRTSLRSRQHTVGVLVSTTPLSPTSPSAATPNPPAVSSSGISRVQNSIAFFVDGEPLGSEISLEPNPRSLVVLTVVKHVDADEEQRCVYDLCEGSLVHGRPVYLNRISDSDFSSDKPGGSSSKDENGGGYDSQRRLIFFSAEALCWVIASVEDSSLTQFTHHHSSSTQPHLPPLENVIFECPSTYSEEGGSAGDGVACRRHDGWSVPFHGWKLRAHQAHKSLESTAKDKPSDIQFLFVYGSLRPDDNSGQSWTKNFVKGFSFQARGQLKGARMFHDDFAAVTLDGNPEELVYGYVLGLPGKSEAWKKKLEQADGIEGFDESSPKDSLYKRAVVEVTMLLPKKGSDNKIVMVQEVIKTFIYHRPDCLRHTRIMSGDWLQRMTPNTVEPAHTLGVGPFIIPDELPALIKNVSKTQQHHGRLATDGTKPDISGSISSLSSQIMVSVVPFAGTQLVSLGWGTQPVYPTVCMAPECGEYEAKVMSLGKDLALSVFGNVSQPQPPQKIEKMPNDAKANDTRPLGVPNNSIDDDEETSRHEEDKFQLPLYDDSDDDDGRGTWTKKTSTSSASSAAPAVLVRRGSRVFENHAGGVLRTDFGVQVYVPSGAMLKNELLASSSSRAKPRSSRRIELTVREVNRKEFQRLPSVAEAFEMGSDDPTAETSITTTGQDGGIEQVGAGAASGMQLAGPVLTFEPSGPFGSRSTGFREDAGIVVRVPHNCVDPSQLRLVQVLSGSDKGSTAGGRRRTTSGGDDNISDDDDRSVGSECSAASSVASRKSNYSRGTPRGTNHRTSCGSGNDSDGNDSRPESSHRRGKKCHTPEPDSPNRSSNPPPVWALVPPDDFQVVGRYADVRLSSLPRYMSAVAAPTGFEMGSGGAAVVMGSGGGTGGMQDLLGNSMTMEQPPWLRPDNSLSNTTADAHFAAASAAFAEQMQQIEAPVNLADTNRRYAAGFAAGTGIGGAYGAIPRPFPGGSRGAEARPGMMLEVMAVVFVPRYLTPRETKMTVMVVLLPARTDALKKAKHHMAARHPTPLFLSSDFDTFGGFHGNRGGGGVEVAMSGDGDGSEAGGEGSVSTGSSSLQLYDETLKVVSPGGRVTFKTQGAIKKRTWTKGSTSIIQKMVLRVGSSSNDENSNGKAAESFHAASFLEQIFVSSDAQIQSFGEDSEQVLDLTVEVPMLPPPRQPPPPILVSRRMQMLTIRVDGKARGSALPSSSSSSNDENAPWYRVEWLPLARRDLNRFQLSSNKLPREGDIDESLFRQMFDKQDVEFTFQGVYAAFFRSRAYNSAGISPYSAMLAVEPREWGEAESTSNDLGDNTSYVVHARTAAKSGDTLPSDQTLDGGSEQSRRDRGFSSALSFRRIFGVASVRLLSQLQQSSRSKSRQRKQHHSSSSNRSSPYSSPQQTLLRKPALGQRQTSLSSPASSASFLADDDAFYGKRSNTNSFDLAFFNFDDEQDDFHDGDINNKVNNEGGEECRSSNDPSSFSSTSSSATGGHGAMPSMDIFAIDDETVQLLHEELTYQHKVDAPMTGLALLASWRIKALAERAKVDLPTAGLLAKRTNRAILKAMRDLSRLELLLSNVHTDEEGDPTLADESGAVATRAERSSTVFPAANGGRSRRHALSGVHKALSSVLAVVMRCSQPGWLARMLDSADATDPSPLWAPEGIVQLYYERESRLLASIYAVEVELGRLFSVDNGSKVSKSHDGGSGGDVSALTVQRKSILAALSSAPAGFVTGESAVETAARWRQYEDVVHAEPPSLLHDHLRITLARYGPSIEGGVAQLSPFNSPPPQSPDAPQTSPLAVSGLANGESYAQHIPPMVIKALSLDLLMTPEDLEAELAIEAVIDAVNRLRAQPAPDPYHTFKTGPSPLPHKQPPNPKATSPNSLRASPEPKKKSHQQPTFATMAVLPSGEEWHSPRDESDSPDPTMEHIYVPMPCGPFKQSILEDESSKGSSSLGNPPNVQPSMTDNGPTTSTLTYTESDGSSNGSSGEKPMVGATSNGSGNDSNGHGGGGGEEIAVAEEEEERPLQPHEWLQHETLGAGAFGTVFLALNCRTGTTMAVKRISERVAESHEDIDGNDSDDDIGDNDDEKKGRAAAVGRGEHAKGSRDKLGAIGAEIRLMQRLKHRNIVRYLGVAYDDSATNQRNGQTFSNDDVGGGRQLCIFMEYMPLGSLKQVMRKFTGPTGGLPLAPLLKYLQQILSGLTYLHAKGVVHRDIKCANILMDQDGKVKLADFGCSFLLRKSETKKARVMLRKSGSGSGSDGGDGSVEPGSDSAQPDFAGSLPWMAPDAFTEKPQSAQDIWSLGITVLEMASGRHPWPSFEHHAQLMYHIGYLRTNPHLKPTLASVLAARTNDPSVGGRRNRGANATATTTSARDCLLSPAASFDLHAFVDLCLELDPASRPTAAELKGHAVFGSAADGNDTGP